MIRNEQGAADRLLSYHTGTRNKERLLSTSQEEFDLLNTANPSRAGWIDPQMGAVYVIGNSANSLLKIGHADNVKNRFSGLNVGSPVELELLHFVYFVGRLVAKSVEQYVHGALAEYRRRGEWFEADLPMVGDAISQVAFQRNLKWFTEEQRRRIGTTALKNHCSNFFLRN